MWQQEYDQFAEELFLAGERVPPGNYRQIDSKRDIQIPSKDYLPASLDGRIALCAHTHMGARDGGRKRSEFSLSHHGVWRDING